MVEVCAKILYQVELQRGKTEHMWGFSVEAELIENADRQDELCCYVSRVEDKSVAMQNGKHFFILLYVARGTMKRVLLTVPRMWTFQRKWEFKMSYILNSCVNQFFDIAERNCLQNPINIYYWGDKVHFSVNGVFLWFLVFFIIYVSLWFIVARALHINCHRKICFVQLRFGSVSFDLFWKIY